MIESKFLGRVRFPVVFEKNEKSPIWQFLEKILEDSLMIDMFALWVIAAITIVSCISIKYWTNLRCETWWHPKSKKGSGVSWDDVAAIIDSDPIGDVNTKSTKGIKTIYGEEGLKGITRYIWHKFCKYGYIIRNAVYIFLSITALIFVFWATFFFDPKFPSQDGQFYWRVAIGGGGVLFLTAIVSAIQIRAQVQSKNRIEWINDFRT
ncbi:hypothetical protein [Limimonas halophila]|uniref:hypothetical protein n=1 Tax=Limimonas halophila TaxID=1082479 RepID=UPI00115FE203|nr:hypothetical protein [Limimonas halophila]